MGNPNSRSVLTPDLPRQRGPQHPGQNVWEGFLPPVFAHLAIVSVGQNPYRSIDLVELYKIVSGWTSILRAVPELLGPQKPGPKCMGGKGPMYPGFAHLDMVSVGQNLYQSKDLVEIYKKVSGWTSIPCAVSEVLRAQYSHIIAPASNPTRVSWESFLSLGI